MNKNGAPYTKVTIFPPVFYTKKGEIDKEFITGILKTAASLNKSALGPYLKNLCNALGKRRLLAYNKRLNYITETLPDPNFRIKWYTMAGKKEGKKKGLATFYDYILLKILFDSLEYASSDNESEWIHDCFWRNDVEDESLFLSSEKVETFITFFLKNDVDKRDLALYLWAFLEAQVWCGVEGTSTESDKKLHDSIHQILEELGETDVLRMCLGEPHDVEKSNTQEQLEKLKTSDHNVRLEKKGTVDLGDDKNLLEWTKVNRPPSLDHIQRLLSEINELNRNLQIHLKDSDFVSVKTDADRLAELQTHLSESLDFLKKEVSSNDSPFNPPDLPQDVMTSNESAEKYLNSLESLVHRFLVSALETIDNEKDKLRQQFDSLGMDIPGALSKADSLDAIEKINNEWSERLEFERIYRNCLDKGIKNSGIDKLDAGKRFDIFNRLAVDESEVRNLEGLLLHIIKDPEAMKSNRSQGGEVLLDLTKECLKSDQPLPDGVWALAYDLDSENLVSFLKNGRVALWLESSENFDITGFKNVMKNHMDIISDKLKLRIELSSLKDLSADSQISTLSNLLRDYPYENEVGIMLIKALCTTGRYAESLYLASLGAKAGWTGLSDDNIKEPLLKVLLQAVDREGIEPSVYSDILNDFEWLTGSDEDIVILLYLLCRSGQQNTLINLRYQAADTINSAKERYPVIIEHLMYLGDEMESQESVDLEVQTVISQGRKALRNFEHDIKKISCYTRWPPATKYQSFFRRRLEKSMEAVKSSSALPNFNEEDLINEAQNTGLPRIQGNALQVMRRYISTQIERIHCIGEAVSHVSFEELQQERIGVLEKIKEEASLYSNHSTLGFVYQHVIEEMT